MAHDVTVRWLGPDDAEELHAFRLAALTAHPEAFLSHVDEERAAGTQRWRDRLSQNLASGGPATMLGAFVGDRLIGMLGLMRDRSLKRRHRAEIVAVYVAPEWRGRGVAGRLLDGAIDLARSLGGVEILSLSVADGNEPALRAYRSRGFRAWGVEPDFLRVDGVPQDEVHMILDLRDRTRP